MRRRSCHNLHCDTFNSRVRALAHMRLSQACCHAAPPPPTPRIQTTLCLPSPPCFLAAASLSLSLLELATGPVAQQHVLVDTTGAAVATLRMNVTVEEVKVIRWVPRRHLPLAALGRKRAVCVCVCVCLRDSVCSCV
jgi:hypothetical protein